MKQCQPGSGPRVTEVVKDREDRYKSRHRNLVGGCKDPKPGCLWPLSLGYVPSSW